MLVQNLSNLRSKMSFRVNMFSFHKFRANLKVRAIFENFSSLLLVDTCIQEFLWLMGVKSLILWADLYGLNFSSRNIAKSVHLLDLSITNFGLLLVNIKFSTSFYAWILEIRHEIFISPPKSRSLCLSSAFF